MLFFAAWMAFILFCVIAVPIAVLLDKRKLAADGGDFDAVNADGQVADGFADPSSGGEFASSEFAEQPAGDFGAGADFGGEAADFGGDAGDFGGGDFGGGDFAGGFDDPPPS